LYDVTIIGAGIAGVFLVYKLASSGHTVLLLDKGKQLEDRFCPLDKGETCSCDRCDTYYGFGGLGKSEGKFNYTNGFGGELENKVGEETFQKLMQEVDDILCRFGGDRVTKYSTSNPTLSHRAEEAGLKMISTEVRHLGTVLSIEILQKIYDYLQKKIEMRFDTDITAIERHHDRFTIQTDREAIQSRKVVIATGRSGAGWLKEIWDSLGLKASQTRLDLGIRVEMKAEQFRSILQDTFETKLVYQHGNEIATTYCMNPHGRIVRKYQDGLVMPDGQNYREQGGIGTSNLNFTLFVPKYFPTHQAADNYAYTVIKGINQDNDRIVVQRWGDLLQDTATSLQQMEGNQVQPTLYADHGNLRDELPLVYVDMLQKFFTRLELLIREPIHPDTLLYGVDAKFYAPIVKTDRVMQTEISGLYAIGDCSGVTHSLSQAAANGLYVGECLRSSMAKFPKRRSTYFILPF
jgi:uncharacterized FAD-dependent dehydrogenase